MEMSKKCLKGFEMSKAESLIVEFFNNADAVQVEEGTWYYSESSVNSELLEVYAQLAKANERVALLERVERVFNESPELTFDNVKDMFSDELNKFAIEQQIKALNWCLSRCNHSFDSWADVGMYDSGISNTEIKDHIEQLRKEQE